MVTETDEEVGGGTTEEFEDVVVQVASVETNR